NGGKQNGTAEIRIDAFQNRARSRRVTDLPEMPVSAFLPPGLFVLDSAEQGSPSLSGLDILSHTCAEQLCRVTRFPIIRPTRNHGSCRAALVKQLLIPFCGKRLVL